MVGPKSKEERALTVGVEQVGADRPRARSCRTRGDQDLHDTPVIVDPGDFMDDMSMEHETILANIYIDEGEYVAALNAARMEVDYARGNQKKIFWELYFDQRNLSKAVANGIPGRRSVHFQPSRVGLGRPEHPGKLHHPEEEGVSKPSLAAELGRWRKTSLEG